MGTPNTPRVVSAWRQQQDTQRRGEGAPGARLQLAQPHLQGLPSATTLLLLLPALTLGWPRGAPAFLPLTGPSSVTALSLKLKN